MVRPEPRKQLLPDTKIKYRCRGKGNIYKEMGLPLNNCVGSLLLNKKNIGLRFTLKNIKLKNKLSVYFKIRRKRSQE